MKLFVTKALGATENELKQLSDLGYDIDLIEDERLPVTEPEKYDAVICNNVFQFNDIREFTKLKYIQLISAGFDRVPIDFITEHNIEIHNAAGVYSIPMAEWTVMRILEAYRTIGFQFECQKNSIWKKGRGWTEIYGKNALIVGYGAYGTETAKRLKAFGMNITVVNRTIKDSPYADRFLPLSELNNIIGEADVVILAVGLVPETAGLFDSEMFSRMKEGSLFINAARGGLVDEGAMISALESGKLLAASIDVFTQEPLPADSPLWKTKNIYLTPHNSFIADGNHKRLFNVVYENAKKYSGKENGNT